MFDLTGKSALVTGSSQGIGKEIAGLLSKTGARVFVHASKDINKAKAVCDGLKDAVPVVGDLTEGNCADSLYNQTGDVDILVLNASVQIRKQWDKITPDEFDTQINVNLKSTLSLIQKYAPYMKEQKFGRIVTVGSVQQFRPHPDMAVYAASKCAIVSLVNNLAKQLAPFGVTVNNMSPGVIATPRNDDALADENYKAKILSGIPMGFVGEETDCAPGVLLLCSDEGRYITGTDLIIDGGMHL